MTKNQKSPKMSKKAKMSKKSKKSPKSPKCPKSQKSPNSQKSQKKVQFDDMSEDKMCHAKTSEVKIYIRTKRLLASPPPPILTIHKDEKHVYSSLIEQFVKI